MRTRMNVAAVTTRQAAARKQLARHRSCRGAASAAASVVWPCLINPTCCQAPVSEAGSLLSPPPRTARPFPHRSRRCQNRHRRRRSLQLGGCGRQVAQGCCCHRRWRQNQDCRNPLARTMIPSVAASVTSPLQRPDYYPIYPACPCCAACRCRRCCPRRSLP